MRCRIFLISWILTTLLALAAVAALNFLVDVNGIYHGEDKQFHTFIQDYVAALRGSSFGVRQAPFERPIKLELARQGRADCYVLGSSHEMQIALDRDPSLSSRWHCGSLLNLAVSGGGFEDALTLLGGLADRQGATVFVGMGPWFFTYNADARWSEYQTDYDAARRYFGLVPRQQQSFTRKKLQNLVNGDYALRNIEALKSGKRQYLPEIVEAGADGVNLHEDEAFYRPDGSLTYSRQYLANNPPDMPKQCADYKVAPPFVSQPVVQEFEDILQKLRQSGLKIVLLMVPYSPTAAGHCNGQTALALHIAESEIRRLAERLGIDVAGGYQPSDFALTDADFLDYMHLRAENLGRVF